LAGTCTCPLIQNSASGVVVRSVKTSARCVATTVVLTAGLGLAGVGAAATAQADFRPAPSYHWCPGQNWDQHWGNNWDGGTCHDDHHRDVDGNNHDHDFFVPIRNYIPRFHWCPGEFWHPEWGFNFDWNTCHDDHHRDGDGDNHNNDWWR
jgi:hypothetical protein